MVCHASFLQSRRFRAYAFSAVGSLFQMDLPFVQVERLLRVARTEHGAFEDGTPLPTPIA